MPQDHLRQLMNSLVNNDLDSAKEHFKNHVDSVAPNFLPNNDSIEIPSEETK